MTSLNKFSKACASLKTLFHKQGCLEFIIIGDIKTDIKLDFVRCMNLLDSLHSYRIITKDLSFSYVHNSGSLSDIDRVIFSPLITSSTVQVHEDEQDIDHLPLSLYFSTRTNSTAQTDFLPLNGSFGVIGKMKIYHYIFQPWPYSLVHYVYPCIYSS